MTYLLVLFNLVLLQVQQLLPLNLIIPAMVTEVAVLVAVAILVVETPTLVVVGILVGAVDVADTSQIVKYVGSLVITPLFAHVAILMHLLSKPILLMLSLRRAQLLQQTPLIGTLIQEHLLI